MAALSLHHAIFTKEKDFDVPFHAPATFLHPAPEGDGNPTSQLFMSAAYQDLIQRQPTHPDGPTSGWDLGLNLLGDPITAAERQSLEDHRTKMKLRRLYAINIAFELLFGVWGTYTTVRYCLAFTDGLGDIKRVCALVLGIVSAFSIVFVITSIFMPLFPRQSRPHLWRYTRSFLRTGYLLLLSAGAVMNFVLVLIWHPTQLCNWDVDISWYSSAVNTTTSPCHTASFAAWITAATVRLVVTLTLALSFIYTLRSYYGTRHPNSPKYSPYLPSDPEDISPVSASSPLHLSKSAFRLARSEDSSRTLNQSHTTLPKSNSISTLAPSTSCTGHSRSHSTVSPPRISPPTSRRTSTHATNHGPEIPSQTQPVSVVTPPWTASHMLQRTSHLSAVQVTPDTMLPDSDGPCDPSEVRSFTSWKLGGHRGTASAHLDVRQTTLPWENINGHVRHASQLGVGPESLSSTHDGGESIKEKTREDDVLVCSYGYGVSGPAYPYLDTYNPQRPARDAESPSSCEDADERGLLRVYRGSIPRGPAPPEVFSEPRSSPSWDEEEEESSGEEEEYVAMMGGFVRRMATIESLGSKEAVGTLSTTGSVALRSMRSKTGASQLSSVRFAEHGSSGASALGIPSGSSSSSSRDGSHSTTYLSFSSGGGTGVWVNERGELLPGPNANGSAAGSPYDRQYYTASGGSFPRMDDEDQ